jgi:hypothetical protein
VCACPSSSDCSAFPVRSCHEHKTDRLVRGAFRVRVCRNCTQYRQGHATAPVAARAEPVSHACRNSCRDGATRGGMILPQLGTRPGTQAAHCMR